MIHADSTTSCVSWRVRITPSLAAVFTLLGGRWHWRADAANAQQSAGHASYPAAMAAARRALGLPAIGEAGLHIHPEPTLNTTTK